MTIGFWHAEYSKNLFGSAISSHCGGESGIVQASMLAIYDGSVMGYRFYPCENDMPFQAKA
jgi:hypothetical protein